MQTCVEAVREYLHVPEVCTLFCNAAAACFGAGNDYTAADSFSGDAFTVVLAAMDAHQGSESVQAAACAFLGLLVQRGLFSGIDEARCKKADAMSRVCAAVDRHRTSAAVQEGAWSVFLSWPDAWTSRGADRITLLQRVYASLECVSASENVLAGACDSLRMMCLETSVTDREEGSESMYALRNQLIATGGLARLLAVMQAHLASRRIQQTACNMLECMTVVSDTSASADLAGLGALRDAVVASGALMHVFAAMQSHPAVPQLQLKACGILRNVIEAPGSPDNGDAIVSSGGMQCLFAAMAANRTCVPVQTLACLLLHELLSRPDAESACAMTLAGLEHILAALDLSDKAATRTLASHALDDLADLVEAAASVLIELAGNSANASVLMAGGKTVAALQGAMRPLQEKRRRISRISRRPPKSSAQDMGAVAAVSLALTALKPYLDSQFL
ncbi:MAG: hypothetical protein P4L40_13685 [Terracidiphilus sp.]|nr:hypothetical protein [Terracidiphilus sp.]